MRLRRSAGQVRVEGSTAPHSLETPSVTFTCPKYKNGDYTVITYSIKPTCDIDVIQRTAWREGTPARRSLLPWITPTLLGPPACKPLGTVATGYDAPPRRGTNAVLALSVSRMMADTLSKMAEWPKMASGREKAAQSPASEVLRHGFTTYMKTTYDLRTQQAGRQRSNGL